MYYRILNNNNRSTFGYEIFSERWLFLFQDLNEENIVKTKKPIHEPQRTGEQMFDGSSMMIICRIF